MTPIKAKEKSCPFGGNCKASDCALWVWVQKPYKVGDDIWKEETNSYSTNTTRWHLLVKADKDFEGTGHCGLLK